MDFDELLSQILELLQRQKRVSYRALKVRLQLDDDLLDAVKDELIYAQQVARDEEERVLVWTGDVASTPSTSMRLRAACNRSCFWYRRGLMAVSCRKRWCSVDTAMPEIFARSSTRNGWA